MKYTTISERPKSRKTMCTELNHLKELMKIRTTKAINES